MNGCLESILYVYIFLHVYNSCNCCNLQHKCIALVMHFCFVCTFCYWRKLNKLNWF